MVICCDTSFLFSLFDILHVAAALKLGATEFLTFDGNQKKLAESEGLRVPLFPVKSRKV
jgi:hypothetical protein